MNYHLEVFNCRMITFKMLQNLTGCCGWSSCNNIFFAMHRIPLLVSPTESGSGVVLKLKNAQNGDSKEGHSG